MGGAQVLGFAEALDLVLRHAAQVRPPGSEQVALLASAGRVLAGEVLADRDQPPFDRATRDGFAVRAEDFTAGQRLGIAGQVRAGEAWVGELASGCAIEIMTGAPVPHGADAVAMLEHADQAGGEVWATAGRSLQAGENIVRRASEARQGDVLLAPGAAIGAAEIALAASCGCVQLAVYRQPKVAIVATGDELVELDQTPQPHQIRNSNSYALAAMVQAAGGRAQRLPIARDTRDDLRDRIAEGCKSDLLLLSGGVSAGKYDLVEDVLAEFGAEFFFTGVKMQPGKPVVFGRLPRAASRRASQPEDLDAGVLIGTGFSPSATSGSLIGTGFSPSETSASLIGTGFSPSASSASLIGTGFSPSESSASLIGTGLSPSETSASLIGTGFSPSETSASLIGTGFSPSESGEEDGGALAPEGTANEWTYFFGLPGNPVSTQVTFHCFVQPLLRALCGAGVAGPNFVQATLTEDIRVKPGLTRFLPASLTHDLTRPQVRLVGWQGSGDLAANARANCYAVLPDGLDLRAGDAITLLLR
jgi:molybdopterin molybdotransferase